MAALDATWANVGEPVANGQGAAERTGDKDAVWRCVVWHGAPGSGTAGTGLKRHAEGERRQRVSRPFTDREPQARRHWT